MPGELMGADRVGMHREVFGMPDFLRGKRLQGQEGREGCQQPLPHTMPVGSHTRTRCCRVRRRESQGLQWDLCCCVEVARNDLLAGSCTC